MQNSQASGRTSPSDRRRCPKRNNGTACRTSGNTWRASAPSRHPSSQNVAGNQRQSVIDKRFDLAAAVADVSDGATVLVGGFGAAGSPIELLHALIDQGAKNLTVVSNNAGSGNVGLAALIEQGRVAKMICSFPRTANSSVFPDKYRAGEIELELVPQGTLAERLRAGGAGIPAFYTATAAGTLLAE